MSGVAQRSRKNKPQMITPRYIVVADARRDAGGQRVVSPVALSPHGDAYEHKCMEESLRIHDR